MAVAGKKKIFDNKYEILSIVGRGSRSVVYQARNVADDNSEVALKVLIENKKDKISNSEKLRREALAMVSSHHPYVVRLDDFHSVGDICYLSMEYAPEADLRKYAVKLGGKIPVDQAENYLLQICEALEYIHRVGIIHRDIKPDNLLVVDEREIRVGDFGVALLPGDENAPHDLSNAVGTMQYMAPEVLQGIDYNQRSDIYSLAITFFEMIAGYHPFEDASLAAQLTVRQDENIPVLSDVSEDIPQYLSEAIQRAMAFDPKDRFSSAKELLQHLKQKRIQKQSVSVPKKEKEEIPKRDERPQLKVISGSGGMQQSTPETSVAEPIEAVETVEESPPVTVVEEKPLEAKDTEISAESTPLETPIGDQVVEVPLEPQKEIMEAPETRPAIAKSSANAAPVALKDSRASRTPTVFIPKDSAERIREENDRLRGAQRTKSTTKFEPRKAPQSSSMAVGMAVIGILATIVAWNSFTSKSAETVQSSKVEQTEESSVLPSYDGEEMSFPDLPSGVFVGSVKGLLPNSLVGMTVISSGESKQLSVLLGLNGWSPALITLGETNPSVIRVVSNGFILEFSGQVNNGIIQGTVKNLVTGTQGAFALKPA